MCQSITAWSSLQHKGLVSSSVCVFEWWGSPRLLKVGGRRKGGGLMSWGVEGIIRKEARVVLMDSSPESVEACSTGLFVLLRPHGEAGGTPWPGLIWGDVYSLTRAPLCLPLQPFHPMVNLQCSPDLRMFLCALYAPVCTEYGRMTLPCRRLCLQARSDCYKLMDMFGVSWPQEMECTRWVHQKQSLPPPGSISGI